MTSSPNTTQPVLAVRGLAVHYGGRPALCDIDLTIQRGQIVSFVGPNGAGKSTLLKVLAGMLQPSHGTVVFDGAPLRKPRSGITYVPQRSGAAWDFPVSVLDTVLMGIAARTPRWRPFSQAERRRALDALDRVGMRRFASVQIGQLSGGQQQRVFLARALLSDGEVFLLDEPFTGVDVPTQELMVGLFEKLRERGATIIYATHDLAQAASNSDVTVLLNQRIIAAGPPTDVFTERPLRETFGGQVVILTAPAPTTTPEPAIR
jgi:ABC-type Mn2+/Zn2+ transport system ATPase subunit